MHDKPNNRIGNTVRSNAHMFSRLGSLLAAGLLASACATARADAPIERPALEVPPVPPRIVEPAPAPDLGNFEPVADLPPEKPAPARLGQTPPAEHARDEQSRAAEGGIQAA